MQTYTQSLYLQSPCMCTLVSYTFYTLASYLVTCTDVVSSMFHIYIYSPYAQSPGLPYLPSPYLLSCIHAVPTYSLLHVAIPIATCIDMQYTYGHQHCNQNTLKCILTPPMFTLRYTIVQITAMHMQQCSLYLLSIATQAVVNK